mmetsp:Transcript_13101/g.36930  ORF Transcript_13101/g.36930 Transcript_13101/m.36930 type:complete len:478 (-) Transcript_13101:79-1512(-)
MQARGRTSSEHSKKITKLVVLNELLDLVIVGALAEQRFEVDVLVLDRLDAILRLLEGLHHLAHELGQKVRSLCGELGEASDKRADLQHTIRNQFGKESTVVLESKRVVHELVAKKLEALVQRLLKVGGGEKLLLVKLHEGIWHVAALRVLLLQHHDASNLDDGELGLVLVGLLEQLLDRLYELRAHLHLHVLDEGVLDEVLHLLGVDARGLALRGRGRDVGATVHAVRKTTGGARRPAEAAALLAEHVGASQASAAVGATRTKAARDTTTRNARRALGAGPHAARADASAGSRGRAGRGVGSGSATLGAVEAGTGAGDLATVSELVAGAHLRAAANNHANLALADRGVVAAHTGPLAACRALAGGRATRGRLVVARGRATARATAATTHAASRAAVLLHLLALGVAVHLGDGLHLELLTASVPLVVAQLDQVLDHEAVASRDRLVVGNLAQRAKVPVEVLAGLRVVARLEGGADGNE